MRVYEDKHAVTLLAQFIAKYPSIWESKSFVQILFERWLKVPLKPRLKVKVSAIKPRVYFLKNKARQLVSKTFDEMHHFGHFKFTTKHILFGFPVFGL